MVYFGAGHAPNPFNFEPQVPIFQKYLVVVDRETSGGLKDCQKPNGQEC